METGIRWRGTGEPVLFFPGWNTAAETVLSWMPEALLSRFRCGVVEWPGLGRAEGTAPPADLEGFLSRVAGELPEGPVPVVGFCLGGIAAWALARRHPERARLSVLVETPLHFPAVLAPLLVPGLGGGLMALAKGTRAGRSLVSRAILHPTADYPRDFLDGLFAFDGRAAVAYLRLFRRYAAALPRRHGALPPCVRMAGDAPVRVLGPSLGRRHRIEARVVRLEGGGHFPAVEAPGAFFDRLAEVLSAPRIPGLLPRPAGLVGLDEGVVAAAGP